MCAIVLLCPVWSQSWCPVINFFKMNSFIFPYSYLYLHVFRTHFLFMLTNVYVFSYRNVKDPIEAIFITIVIRFQLRLFVSIITLIMVVVSTTPTKLENHGPPSYASQTPLWETVVMGCMMLQNKSHCTPKITRFHNAWCIVVLVPDKDLRITINSIITYYLCGKL